MLPKDPEILYSMINLKLRDYYSNLDDLCEDQEEDKEAVLKTLENAGYVYNAAENRFMPKPANADGAGFPDESPYKRVLFIINPKSGVKKKGTALNDIILTFSEHGYETVVCFTRKQGDGTKLVVDHANESIDIICCMGGDGTLNEMLTGAVQIGWKKPMGYIPAGSTNDFAVSRGIPVDPIQAAESIMTGTPHSMDLGEFNGRTYVYTAANGLFASTTYTTPQNIKNTLGHFAYILEGAKDAMQFKPLHLKIDLGNEQFEDDYIFITICNTFTMGGVMNLDKANVDFSDGYFEILMVKQPSDPIELHLTVQALINQDFDFPGIAMRKINYAKVYHEEGSDWSLDGERGAGRKENEFRVLHNAVSLIY